MGRSVARSTPTTKDRRTAVSPFRSLPELHPHEVELRVAVKDLSRDVAPEKFRSKAKSVGGFVFGLLVFPQGTKSAPEHARKSRPGKKDDDKDKDKDKDKKDEKDDEKSKVNRTKKEKEKVKAALLKEVPKEKDKDADKDDAKKDKKDTRWISAFVEARPTEDYPAHWFFEDVQFLVSLINFQDLKKSIVKHDKHTFSPVESSDGKAIDRGWHDFVHCDEVTLRTSGFVDSKDDTVCFRASVYLAGAMKVNSKTKSRYMSLGKIDPAVNEKVPRYLNSLVQVWYHLGLFRNAIYSASITGPGQKKTSVLPALREVFVRLQHRTLAASCSPLCSAFGRKTWSKMCKADADSFCTEIFQSLQAEFIPSAEVLKAEEAGAKAAGKAKAKAKAIPRVVEVPLENRALWETIQEMFEFEVEWIAQAIDGGDFSDSHIYQGPCFTLVVRGFTCLEDTLDHYFSPRIIEDGSGLRVKTMRKFRRMPNVLQWCLKRGDYDCGTGLSGVTETFLSFPRQIDMGKYSEGAGLYHLYAIMVECDDHFLSYIRPEMEGDRGQWYRFDERESSCAVSNATAVDSSFGGEEWLCVNYLYGPSAVLKRPRESRASMLIYAKDDMLRTLLRELRLPKLCPELHMPLQREMPQAGSVELEAANRAEAELLEVVDAELLAEVRKKKAKQKKKQKEKQIKERKNQARTEETEATEATNEKDEAESEEEEEEEEKPAKVDLQEVEARAMNTPTEFDEEGFEENLRAARGKKARGAAKAKAGPAPAESNNKNKKKESQAYPAYPSPGLPAAPQPAPVTPMVATASAKEPVVDDNKSASEGRRSPRSSDAGSTAGSVAKGALRGEQKSGGQQVKTLTPSEGSAPNAPNATGGTPNLGNAAANGPRPNGTAPARVNGVPASAQSKPARAEPKAREQPQPGPAATPAAAQPLVQATHAAQAAQGAQAAQARPPAIAHAASISSVATTAEMGEGTERHHPSSSSRSLPKDDGVKIYPEQLIAGENLMDDYAQFICAICKLVARHPVMMRSCVHIFCDSCFRQYVNETRPNVCCPTCQQAVKKDDVVKLESATGAGLALLHRLYSGMKVRCVYHPETGEVDSPEVAKAKRNRLSCKWSGALLDFTVHLGNCQVHAAVCEPRGNPGRGLSDGGLASASAPREAREAREARSLRGICVVTEPYQVATPGTLSVQRGMHVWVNDVGEHHAEWAWGQLYQDFQTVSDPAWVPRCVLKQALYWVRGPFDREGQPAAQTSYLHLWGSEVVTVENFNNGWTYGTKMAGPHYNQPEESGWYPQACIGNPLE